MVEGTLVRLRKPDAPDAPAYHRWFNDREVTDFLIADRYPRTLFEEQQFLERIPSMSLVDGVILAIETKDGHHIGWTSLYKTSPEDRSSCFAVTIGEKEYWSRGYGGDAIVATLRLGFHEMNLNRVWLTTVEYNARAITCYRRCGFVEEARLRQDVYRHGRYWDFIEMAVLRHEFDALQQGGHDA